MNAKYRYFLILCFGTIFFLSAWNIYKIQIEYKKGRDTYSLMEQYVSFETDTVDKTEAEKGRHLQKEPDEIIVNDRADPLVDAMIGWPNVDFASLRNINPDIVAWLYIEGTEISYPVVQGSDNDYYLKHLFDRSYGSTGCLFMDVNCESNFSGLNSIIYGHHMKDGSMFSELMQFKNQSFYEEHPFALLVTPEHRYKILFFSAYVTATESNAWETDFTSESYAEWQMDLKAKSFLITKITPAQHNSIITLSTCSYEFNNARFVVHGILEECP